jgi:hypothetical protein
VGQGPGVARRRSNRSTLKLSFRVHLSSRRQLSFNELVALYAITDVALVTSLRDGMNLGGLVGGWGFSCVRGGRRQRRKQRHASALLSGRPPWLHGQAGSAA